MIYLQLAFEFFKTGLFAVGGGLATLPFLMQMSQTYPQWFSIDELMQMVAISESTPGPIGVNMATYVGFHTAGIPGAVTATFALILPAFLTILVVVRILHRFQTNRRIMGGMEALRPAVTGLIAAAGYVVLKSVLFAEQGGTFHASVGSFGPVCCFIPPAQVQAAQPHPSHHLYRGRSGAWHCAEAVGGLSEIRRLFLTESMLYTIIDTVVSNEFYRNAP